MPAKKKTNITKRSAAKGSGESLNFTALVDSIQQYMNKAPPMSSAPSTPP